MIQVSWPGSMLKAIVNIKNMTLTRIEDLCCTRVSIVSSQIWQLRQEYPDEKGSISKLLFKSQCIGKYASSINLTQISNSGLEGESR